MNVPPDPDSVVNAIKRAHLQTFLWLRCCQQSINTPDPEDFGWEMKDERLTPVWFNCDQFPPSITRRKQKTRNDSSDADNESSDLEESPKKKVRKTLTRKSKRKSPELDESQDADEESPVVDANESFTLSSDTIPESEWEVSDFLSSDESCDEWLP